MRVIVFVFSVIAVLAGIGLVIGAFVASTWDFSQWDPRWKSILALIWLMLSLGFTELCWASYQDLKEFLRFHPESCSNCSTATNESTGWKKKS